MACIVPVTVLIVFLLFTWIRYDELCSIRRADRELESKQRSFGRICAGFA